MQQPPVRRNPVSLATTHLADCAKQHKSHIWTDARTECIWSVCAQVHEWNNQVCMFSLVPQHIESFCFIKLIQARSIGG